VTSADERPSDLPNGKSGLDGRGLDPTSAALVDALTENPRASAAELARQVGLSAPTVRERIGRLERDGVIRGYRVDIDPAALGLPVAAWVRVKPGPGQLSRIAELAERVPQVSECHRITGEDCFLLKVHVPDIAQLEEILDQFLMHGQTNSSFIVSTPVTPRMPSA